MISSVKEMITKHVASWNGKSLLQFKTEFADDEKKKYQAEIILNLKSP